MGRPGARRAPRSRNYCFTDYKCDADAVAATFAAQDGPITIRYLAYGREMCPNSDPPREHFQGWCQFSKPVSLPSAQRIMRMPNTHFEICRGSCHDNEVYISKAGEVTRFGAFISMGVKQDVEEIRVCIREGHSMLQIADGNFPLYLRFRNSLQAYRFMVMQEKTKPWRDVKVVILEGRTRCGKTRLAAKYGSCILGGWQLQWLDSYDYNRTLIVDDFADDLPIQQMLRFLDGYQLRLALKGSHTWANWIQVIITTNVRDLYSQAPNEHRDAFNARITQVISAWGPLDNMPDSIDGFIPDADV